MSSSTVERRALRLSAFAASLFALTGLTIGVLSGSITILFDSGYSLLSLVLASLSLLALSHAQKPADERYPFGRLTVEPLAVLLKGVVIALVCLFSLVSALWSLYQGGQLVSLDLALWFAFANVAGCAFIWWRLGRYAHRRSSSLIAAEIKQWQMDTWLSAAVLLGFLLTLALSLSPLAAYTRFADPIMVLVIVAYFMPMPVKMIRGALKELMFGAPGGGLRRELADHVADFDVKESDVRLAQVGNFLMVDIQLDKAQIDNAPRILESVTRHCHRRQLRPVTSITLMIQGVKAVDASDGGWYLALPTIGSGS